MGRIVLIEKAEAGFIVESEDHDEVIVASELEIFLKLESYILEKRYKILTKNNILSKELVKKLFRIGYDQIAYVVASNLFDFLIFYLESSLGKTGWPFDPEFVVGANPDILNFRCLQLPWDRGRIS